MRKESQAPRNSRELAVRNQFFTPRYVVQFLTDNTLGRTWYEMMQGDTQLAHLDYLVRRPNEVFLAEGESAPESDTDESELSQEELLQRQGQVWTALGICDDDAVEAYLHLDDADAVLGAVLELGLLHPARRIGHVGVAFTDARAEQLHAAAGARAFDDGGLEAGGLAELLGDGGGEREDGGRADDANLVAGFGAADKADGERGGDGHGLEFHGCLS